MNIVLIGMRATGKTAVATRVAKILKRPFFDTDRLVSERSGRTIPELVQCFGWEYFRDLESSVIQGVARKQNAVIATGGGVVTREKNMRELKKSGFLILLTANITTILSRMNDDSERPALTRHSSKRKEIAEILRERRPLYEKYRDAAVSTNRKSEERVAEEIAALARKKFP